MNDKRKNRGRKGFRRKRNGLNLKKPIPTLASITKANESSSTSAKDSNPKSKTDSLSLISVLNNRSIGQINFTGPAFCATALQTRIESRRSMLQFENNFSNLIMSGYPNLGLFVANEQNVLKVYNLIDTEDESGWKINLKCPVYPCGFYKIEEVSFRYLKLNNDIYSLYVTNNMNGGMAKLLPLYKSTNSSLMAETTHFSFKSKSIWSCDWSHANNTVTFGGEGFVCLQKVDRTERLFYNLHRQNVHSVTFDFSGRLIYAGLNSGQIYMIDTRQPRVSKLVTVARGIGHLRLINDEKQLVASCYDNKLLQIDLTRGSNKDYLEYSGHNNQDLKLPFSFDETSDTLCSVGQDGMIGFWNLKNRNFLYHLEPFEKYENTAWFSDQWQTPSCRNKSGIIASTCEGMFILEF